MNINLRNALSYIASAKAQIDINLKPRNPGALDPRCRTELIDGVFYDVANAKDCLERLRHQLEDLDQ